MLALSLCSAAFWSPPVTLNRHAVSRAATPTMETFEEYKARVLEKPKVGPPTIAGVAQAKGVVTPTPASTRPTRADSRPQLRELLHDSSVSLF